MTSWDLQLGPTVGVLGPRALVDRLGRTVRVQPLLPTAAPVAEVDAVLVARSAVTPGGSWEAALRPVGFDRGVALARLLAAAREHAVPVVLLEDVPVGALDGWHGMLDGAIDEALVLGPLGAGGVCWHPGVHWDPLALRLAAGRGTGGPGAIGPADAGGADGAVEVSPASAGTEWRAAQQAAAAVGRARLDVADPWSRHLAAELVGLGVTVLDAADDPGGAPVPAHDDATPSAAAAWLCAHLDLPAPPQQAVVVHHEHGGQGVASAADERAAVACREALDRLGGEARPVAVHVGGTLAAGDGLATVVAGERLGSIAIDLEALA